MSHTSREREFAQAGTTTQLSVSTTSSGWAVALSSFTHPNYRLYWASSMCQMAPNSMQQVVQALLLYRLTGSTAMLGVMSLANALPMLFFSLFGGIIADRVQKKNVLIVGQVVSALVALSIALSITLNIITWILLLVVSTLQGLIWSFMMPSRQSIIPEIVGESDLANAVALNAAGMNINRLIGPAIAGFMVAWWGFGSVYYAMAGLYFGAALLMVPQPRSETIAIRGGGALDSIREGVIYLRRNTTVLSVLLVTLIMVILSMPYMTLLPVFTEDILKVGPDSLGVLLSVSGIGALIGSLIIASQGGKNRGALLMMSALVLGVGLIGFSISSNYQYSVALMLLVGLGQAGRMALSNSMVQSYTEDRYRGRVMSIYMMEFGLTSLSTFGAGLVAQLVGVQWTVGIASMALVLISAYVLIFVPSIRRLD